jgi:hypothetical protein
MSERQTDEQIQDMLDLAEEAGEVEAGEVTVDAMDLVRVLEEIKDTRHHMDLSPDERLEVRLLNWADSEAGGKAAWQAWFDAMNDQHRDVDRHRSKWAILEPQDQQLDRMIAARVVRAALEACRGGG